MRHWRVVNERRLIASTQLDLMIKRKIGRIGCSIREIIG